MSLAIIALGMIFTFSSANNNKAELAKTETAAVADRLPAGERNAVMHPSQSAAQRPSQVVAPVADGTEADEARITGNWGGARTQLSEKGINLELVYKGEYNKNFSGGLSPGSSYLGNIDFKVALDGEKLFGWKGGSAFVYLLNNHGKRPSFYVGDFQWTSNIEAVTAQTKVYEAWIQQLAFDDQVSFLVGLHDLNSEFYVNDSATLFLHSGFGIGTEIAQTGVNGPSIFPATSMAFRVRVEPSKDFYTQFAVFNAQAGDPSLPGNTIFRANGKDGLLMIAESAFFTGKEDPKKTYSKYGFGAWAYTRTFEHQVTLNQTTNHGAYFIGEQGINESISLFLNYGVASSAVNTIGSCLATGIVFKGLIPGRSDDRFGLGYTKSTASDEFKTAQATLSDPSKGHESVFEGSYRFEVSKGFAIQPDFQYVLNPGLTGNLGNASVGALRFDMSF